jgi:hypothetical protein
MSITVIVTRIFVHLLGGGGILFSLCLFIVKASHQPAWLYRRTHYHHLYFHKSSTVQDVEKSIQIQNKQYRIRSEYSNRGK